MAEKQRTRFHGNTKDIRGMVFGRLTVLERAESKHPGVVYWQCQCSCGERTVVATGHLRNGHTQSCGCLSQERKLVHGGSGTKEYLAWDNIKQRCLNPRHKYFVYYGGRGITICERWRSSFANFLADVGPAPGSQFTIERIDNEFGYFPGNVKWATRREQMLNTRRTNRLTLQGVTRTRTEWAGLTGIKERNIKLRLRRGWSVERALTTPPRTW